MFLKCVTLCECVLACVRVHAYICVRVRNTIHGVCLLVYAPVHILIYYNGDAGDADDAYRNGLYSPPKIEHSLF